ncbi:hypothetical protein V6N11_037541 [Hibiscus sabdariffa]
MQVALLPQLKLSNDSAQREQIHPRPGHLEVARQRKKKRTLELEGFLGSSIWGARKKDMLARRLTSFFKSSPSSKVSSTGNSVNEEKSKSFGRKAVSFVLITVTGGVALSALDDLAVYHGCTSKAMEKASKHQAIIDAIGEPIKKGPWYNASLAVAHKRRSVSCTFPVSGPQGDGVLQLKAVRNGEDTWYSYFLPRDWEILIMEALLHVPGNEEKQRALRISLLENIPHPAQRACTECRPHKSENQDKK